MTDSVSDEVYYKRHSGAAAYVGSRFHLSDDQYADYPTPTRLYQCALVLSGFMATFQTIGANQTSQITDGHGQYAMAALIGTIGGGLTWSGSIPVAWIISKGCNMSLMCLAGSALMSIGLVLASLSTKQFSSASGRQCYTIPVTSLTPVYFDRHRGFAMGIAMAGSGAGGLVLAPVTQSLLARFGAPVTLRILGVWNLAVCIPISFVMRPHPALQLLAAFLQAAGNIIPLYYLTTYSVSVLGLSPTTASMLLALNNAVNSVARVLMGLLADYVGRQNTMVSCVIFSGVSVFAFWYDASYARFLAFVVLYGMASGGYSALLPTTIAEIYGKEQYSSANAAIYFIRGVGAILGAPVAGALLGSHSGKDLEKIQSPREVKMRFNMIAGYDGALLLGAAVCVALVRRLDAQAKGRWKWIA
ncbi:major facilitator superfamily domain-containing protein [Russula earlei]|uniref:Major facilitator superfamily domain-containing protein n=1 Tax=Russula earlei TaxID=71964 RepID=A0ACC0U7W1_9AGAM|nr:major facilitator superfamily domain-containing protein [Russula earlei]